MSWARLGGSFAIPASAEEERRRDIEKELDMHMHAPTRLSTSSFLDDNSLRHSTMRGAYARRLSHNRRPSDSDMSETSDEDEGVQRLLSQSTGNHTVLLATPRGKARRQTLHTRPKLSQYAKDHLDISRIARVGDAYEQEEGTVLPEPPQPAQPAQPTKKPSPSSSRHSSAETKVNDDVPAQLPEDVRWVEQQLNALVSYLQSMEREVGEMRARTTPSTGIEALAKRTATLEANVEKQRQQLTRLSTTFASHQEHCSPEAFEHVIHQLTSRLDRLEPYWERPERPERPERTDRPPYLAARDELEMGPTVARLYEELARISQALEQIQGTHTPPRRGVPLTPPYERPTKAYVPPEPGRADTHYTPPPPVQEAAWRSAEPLRPAEPASHDLSVVQDRYEQICRTVADALGLQPVPDPHLKRSRKERVRAGLRTRESADITAEALLRRLRDVPAPLLSGTELRTLEHIFEQHRHEFLRQKKLYSELADELKQMEPSMDPTKRRILAEHLHASIDSLEAEATRLSDLHAHLARHGFTARHDVYGT